MDIINLPLDKFVLVFMATSSACDCLFPTSLPKMALTELFLNFIFINLFIYFIYFIFGCIGSSCWVQAFSSCGEQGLLFIVVRGLLIVVASLVGARALGTWASVVVAHRVSCSAACGIFPDQGSNPRPLHWQVDS